MLSAESTPSEYVKAPGSEPLPGYKLVAPLGQGGFGEVWKCEVPGGLAKAIKFVPGDIHPLDGDSAPARQELEALQHIKDIRHPFMLSMERVELVGGELVIVMELADQNLHEVLREHQAAGQPGIPRDELVGYLREAAEVLDFMNFQHELQHLDVKPSNLFLVCRHIKVADFGLVNSLSQRTDRSSPLVGAGATPLYAAPEVFNGWISGQSDQYSLAVTYQELLTGTLPIQGKNARQLMLNHLTAAPRLEPLPQADRPLVARALAKEPEKRFSSCMEFMESLLKGDTLTLSARPWESSLDQQREQKASPIQDTPRAQTAADETRRNLPAPVASEDAIPGYTLLECINPNQLGDLWRVQGPDGRERLAQIVNTPAVNAATFVTRLKQLKHPGLVPVDILRSQSGRVFLITDLFTETLRQRFEECRAEGLPGIPRPELLGLLKSAAATLDELAQQQGLPHLAITPRNILAREDRALLFEYGLVALVWGASSNPPGTLNARYAAPELFEKPTSRSADQYSLALVYAEMLTGHHPRPSRAVTRGSAARAPAKLDLDLLPAFDRDTLARALHADPAKRFASCSELIRALENAADSPNKHKDPYRTLPALITLTNLHGEPSRGETSTLPSIARFVTDLILSSTGAVRICEANQLRYLLLPGNVVEHRCPIRMIPSGLRLKLHDFPKQYRAQLVRQDDNNFCCRIPASRSFWQRCFGSESGMEVNVVLQALPDPTPQMVEAVIRIKPYGSTAGLDKEMPQIGPALIDSVRTYLQAEPDQRGRERWPCPHRVQVYPVSSDLQVADPIDGGGKDISLTGIGMRLTQPVTTEYAYITFPGSPLVAAALLTRIVRNKPGGEGYEVAGDFPTEQAQQSKSAKLP